ncbi:protein required for yeast-phase growth [Histoplasma capsulatum]|uniref:Protein required for yeast-phase growth n=1 Tax=Ajellomyces capsulatus TaxID=5037 RepID=A0A8A1M7U7_AJECA|nr:conserved hypothetical protein [Histoplasma mississippiense (nom. inval.)]EDN04591.1 conserved hypothetical protein [Histoplasma mississippiense (nom. inval.)]QSS62588.1 protein required for yeast-phase growth [Histoplasma capsulatum]
MGNGTAAVLEPTFTGYVATTQDALILFEACLTGILHHVPRRPHDRERSQLVKSGSVFIYEENASGIKRWTDGVTWSPSRILGNFLVYRELDKPFPPGEKKRAMKKGNRRPTSTGRPGEPYPRPQESNGTTYSPATSPGAAPYGERNQQSELERQLVGSLVDSYGFKDSGLVKKTMSVTVSGVTHHLVSYYSVEDVMSNRLHTPMQHESLRYIRPRAELTTKQSFRAPIDDFDHATLEDADPTSALYAYRSTLSGAQAYAVPSSGPSYYQLPAYGAPPGYAVGAAGLAGHPASNPYLANTSNSADIPPKQDSYPFRSSASYPPGYNPMNPSMQQPLSASTMSSSLNTVLADRSQQQQQPSSAGLYRNPALQPRNVAPDSSSGAVDPSSAYSRGTFGGMDSADQQNVGQHPPYNPATRRESSSLVANVSYYNGDRQPQQPQSQPPSQPQQSHQPPPQPPQQQYFPGPTHSAHASSYQPGPPASMSWNTAATG